VCDLEMDLVACTRRRRKTVSNPVYIAEKGGRELTMMMGGWDGMGWDGMDVGGERVGELERTNEMALSLGFQAESLQKNHRSLDRVELIEDPPPTFPSIYI